VGVLASKTPG